MEESPAASIERRIVWILRSIARRENRRRPESRRLTDPHLTRWLAFRAGTPSARWGLHQIAVGERRREQPICRTTFGAGAAGRAERLIAAALAPGPWASPNTATYIESVALAFGRPELGQTARVLEHIAGILSSQNAAIVTSIAQYQVLDAAGIAKAHSLKWPGPGTYR